MARTDRTPLQALRLLTAVGAALSSERDHDRLMELILQSARELTAADGGTLYSRTEDDCLKFEIMRTDSLGLELGGTSGQAIDFPPLPLYNEDGTPNNHMVAAWAVHSGSTVAIRDAYDATEFDFSGTRDFDRRTGYRSKSFLTVPMRNHEQEVIGVLQLINALDPETGEVAAFTAEDQQVVEALASQAAITLTRERLIHDHQRLFEAFVELIASAIDDKSPYTGSHCRRVPVLTMMLADAVAETRKGPLADFTMSEEDRYELRVAAWLHDCGKVATPEAVIDKATKLEKRFDRIELVDTRFEVLKRDAKIAALEAEAEALHRGESFDREARRRALRGEIARLDSDRDFLHLCNQGSESMSSEDRQRVERIADYLWHPLTAGEDNTPAAKAFLNDDELKNLVIERGTLTAEEREIINAHALTTIKMLESLPYPKHLARVPEFAGGHHERMDGKGYPRGLVREEMSVQARIMGIADIFEALTAGDRPYKGAMTLSQALTILGQMKLDHHIDPDLFDVFIRERVWERYAESFLKPEQLDAADLAQVPGVPEDVLAEDVLAEDSEDTE